MAAAPTEALKDAGSSIELMLTNAQSNTLKAFDETVKKLDGTGKSIDKLKASISTSRESLTGTRGTLAGVDSTLADLQTAVRQAEAIVRDTQGEIVAFSDAATAAYLKGTTVLADAAASANVSVAELSQ